MQVVRIAHAPHPDVPLDSPLLVFHREQFLPVSTAKDLARRSWEATSDKEMSQFLGWVMNSLRMRGQRVSTRYHGILNVMPTKHTL